MPEQTFNIPYPDKRVFASQGNPTDQVTQETNYTNVIEKIEYPETGGIFIYSVGELYPKKGFPTPEAVWANNIVKRILINQIGFLFSIKFSLLFQWNKLKTIDDWLYEFNRLAKYILTPYYLTDNRYTECSQALRVFIREFLMGIGFLENTADSFGRTFSTLIEYDTAYRYRIEDILSETTSQTLKSAPRREIKRLVGIFAIREARPHLVQKFKWVGIGISLLLLIPKIKRAFRNALDKIDFTKLQLDEIDKYHVLKLSGYEFLGRTVEDRCREYLELHNGNPPPVIELRGVKIIQPNVNN